MEIDRLIGQVLAHYKMLDRLGQGGMGVVYRAWDTHLSRPVAIKVLRSEWMADPERNKRFVQEAKAASALNHPNIVTIFDIATNGGMCYIAMEYVPGQTLGQLIGRKGLPLPKALDYAEQIAGGLAAAHAAGIVHCDVKPANVMITDRHLVKVLDFGLAQLTKRPSLPDPATRTTESLHLSAPRRLTGGGTTAYMSPEQAEDRELDTRSDIFSFGSVFYEMLSGRRAFQGETTIAVLSAILNKEPAPISEVHPEVPREIERVISRCLQKDPESRFQVIMDLKLHLEELKQDLATGRLSSPVPRRAHPRWRKTVLAGSAILLLAAIGGVAWRIKNSPAADGQKVLTRLTADSGLSAYPALSPDGSLLAYASDRGGSNLNLWLRQTAGGESLRLTHHDADDYDPAYSPDGTFIAYRSERDDGGIYVVPTLGGEARLVARSGRRPRYSPDGKWLAYWVGPAANCDIGAKLYLLPSAGGRPKLWQPEFSTACYPTWSPDGRRLLFLGKRDSSTPWPEGADWWVAPVDEGPAVPMMAVATLGRSSFMNFIAPEIWASTDFIIFSNNAGDSTNLWQISISPRTSKLVRSPERLSSGTGLELQPSLAPGGKLAFASLIESLNIWSLPMDTDRARIIGPIQRLTHDSMSDAAPSISMNGNKMAFLSNRRGNNEVWVQDLGSAVATSLTRTPGAKRFPIITADGSRVAFGLLENQKPSIYVVAAGGGVPERVCDDCGLPRSWSADGTKIVFQAGDPYQIRVLDLPSGEKRDLLSDRRYDLTSPRLSPDDRWIAFRSSIRPDRSRLWIAPFRAGTVVGKNEWIAVTDGEFDDDKPRWSPDGNLLYFISRRDGFRCVWGQRLDPIAKMPLKAPFPVTHFHQTRLSMMYSRVTNLDLSVAQDKLVFTLGERTGNIWMTELEPR